MKIFQLLRDGGSFPRYLLVGITTSLLDLALFSTLSVVLGVPAVPSNIVSTLVTICVSYVINQRFVFKGSSHSWRGFFSFAGLTLFTGLVLQSVAIWGVLGISRWLLPGLVDEVVLPAAKIVAMGIGAIANYLGYRFIFRRS